MEQAVLLSQHFWPLLSEAFSENSQLLFYWCQPFTITKNMYVTLSHSSVSVIDGNSSFISSGYVNVVVMILTEMTCLYA